VPSPPDHPGILESALRRDRVIAVFALLTLTALAWAHLFQLAAEMEMHESMPGMEMPGMAMPDLSAWSLRDALLLFLMWAVMMVAMMLPSATPVILLVLATYRRRAGSGSLPASACFAGGYLAVWTAFSAGAALAQWGLHRAALLSPQMAAASPLLGGGLLLAAGIYQWLPIKYACLSHCRSPLGFLSSHWREGNGGALAMGLRHGLYCLGCCWARWLCCLWPG
jgi:predicted metal-binding membrane protein